MGEQSNFDFKERVKEYLKRQNFMNLMKFNLERIETGYTEGTLNIEDIHLQQFGRVHGGVIATMADITAGFAAYTTVGPDFHVVTGEIKVSYLSAAHGPELKAIGRVLKAGRKINFCEAEVYQVEPGKPDKLVAKASASMVVIPRESKS